MPRPAKTKDDPEEIEVPEKPDEKEDVVSVDPPDDDDALEDKTETAAERKRQRPKLMRQAEEAAERAAKAERELAELRGRTQAEIEGLKAQMASIAQQSRGPQVNPARQRFDEIRQREVSLIREFNALTPEQQREKQEEFLAKQADIEWERGLAIAQAAGPQQPQITPERLAEMQNRMRYPDIYGDERVRTWAEARYSLLMAEGYTGDRSKLVEDVANEARVKFNLGGAEPSNADRRRHTDVSRGGRSSSRQPARTIVMTRENKELADAWAAQHKPGTFKSDAEARAAWARAVGPSLVDSE